MGIRVGTGFDAHRFAEGRKLILGGVEIPFELGLEAHSDGDVAVHALMDALLGAAGLPDIGRLFPDNDPAYEGACSLELLKRVMSLLREKGFGLGNADIVLICQKPRLAGYIDSMREAVSGALGCDPGLVGIKATTTEHMGFTGRGEGIAAQAAVLIEII
ncbi:MAG: 2-C-methyl-D-erythritol 2,4-cyclodiphosphate synthase [Firmicutes bacterium]|nr:2-C-methyl-D-erythritol 2,4-cyclodiphosphate synthase [Bacillota bacterium]